jgi:hypothetical protein
MAILRLRALCWLAFFRGQKSVSPRMATAWVDEAFGMTDPKTIRDKWPGIVEKQFDNEFINKLLADAGEAKFPPFQPGPVEEWISALKQDGAEFQALDPTGR